MGRENRGGGPGRLWIGTSGWQYRHWLNGVFYPPRLRTGEQLPFYAGDYPTVEINASYYRLPERSSFVKWREQTPPGFLFAVKASRYLTHMKKLADPEEPLQRLLERASGLEEKLGPILFQFPHTWRLNLERLRHFTGLLREYPDHRFTFEFRHASWLVPEVYALLEEIGAALCLPAAPQMPLDVRLTAPWCYVRMHGGPTGWGFTEGELEWWAGQLRPLLAQGTEVFVYFNNDLGGHALVDSRRFRTLFPAGARVDAFTWPAQQLAA
jgi:uncharacterized protein YecE (DUF72 family)